MSESFEPEPDIDLERPNVARVYDYYLGGETNYAVDRAFGEQVLATFPLLRPIAMANRLYLHRVVRYLTGLGVRQFVDVGSGVPTMGSTHTVADQRAPDSRVVYVDHEPVAVAHSQLLLEQHGDPNRHAAVHADLRDPNALWRTVRETGVVDLRQPVALLLIAVLHVAQFDAHGREIGAEAVAQFRKRLVSGSYLAISHITDEGVPDEIADKLVELKRMYDTSSSPVIWRSRADIAALLGDFEPVPPGLCWTPEWHPEETGPDAPKIRFASPEESVIWAGVGRKP